MSAPVIDEHDATVYQGDVRERLAELPAGSVQCVVTSPPYYGLRDYGVEPSDWPAVPEFDIPAMSCALGLEPSPQAFVAHVMLIFREMRRVLADDGVLWLNLGDSYSFGSTPLHNTNTPNKNRDGSADATSEAIGSSLGYSRKQNSGLPAKNLLGIPWRVAFALQDDGWTLRAEVIWSKRNCMPEAVTDRPSRSHEQFFLFSKKPSYWYDADAIREESDPQQQAHNERYAKVYDAHTEKADGRQPNNQNSKGIHARPGKPGRNARTVWTVSSQPFPGAHFATMPPELARRCILAGCPENGTVLDPFTGSGTTGMVARQLGRKFVGIELNPNYIDIIRGRIGQTPLDFGEAS